VAARVDGRACLEVVALFAVGASVLETRFGGNGGLLAMLGSCGLLGVALIEADLPGTVLDVKRPVKDERTNAPFGDKDDRDAEGTGLSDVATALS